MKAAVRRSRVGSGQVGPASVHRGLLGGRAFGLGEQSLAGGAAAVLLLRVGGRRRRSHPRLGETGGGQNQEDGIKKTLCDLARDHRCVPPGIKEIKEIKEGRNATFRVPTLSSKDLKVGAFL